jgi:hypothetical protein
MSEKIRLMFIGKLISKLSIIGLILLPMSVKAQIANNTSTYKHPSSTESNSSQKRTISGSRGCNGGNTQLTLLVPEDHIGLTVSEHPTFLFSLTEIPSHPIRISVVEPQNPEALFDRTMVLKQSGIIAVPMPPTSQPLQNNKTYILTVGLLCNPSRISASAYTSVAFQKIPANTRLQQELMQASNILERAQIYGQNGIWYEAIALGYEAKKLNILDSIKYFQALISQINL